MNKKLPALAIVFLLFAGKGYSQITISNSDMPSAGDTIRLSISNNFTGVSIDSTGPSSTWDYSLLMPDSQRVDSFVSILSTGLYALSFFNSSFAQKSVTPPISFGAISASYEFDFYRSTSSSYVLSGLGASLTGLPIPLVYSPKDTIYQFPLNYSNTDSTASAFSVSLPGIGFYGGHRIRQDTVDGWGTLITPFGSFSTLRVKSTVNETDTIYLDTLSFGISIPLPEQVEYKWLANGMKVPLLQINTTAGFISSIVYRDSVRNLMPTGTMQPETNENGFNVYPNPASEQATLSIVLSKKETVELQVFDIHGKMIEQMSYPGLQPGLNELILSLPVEVYSNGVYFVKLKCGNNEFVKPVLVGQ